MWSSSARQISYGLPPETGMVGLRDVFVVAPASSFHHHEPIISDPHGINGSNGAAATTALGVGVIPLLTATPCLGPPANIGVDEDGLNTNRSRSSGIQLWQNQQSQHSNFLQSSGGGIGGSVVATCQDCGNQAKKGCSHERCRTCCKSRGFDCSTHVKSTWIPAVRRRERHLKGSTTTVAAGSSGSTSGAKKPRLITSQTTTTTTTTSASNTPPRSFDTSSSHQDASFKEGLPGQVRVPAVFKCVRVTAVDDDDDEYAYQAVVKIGGHVFKGFLYDHGVEEKDGFPNISELHLGGGSGGRGGGGGGRNGASLSSPILDTSAVYGGSGGGLLGVSSYGNQMIN